MSFLNSALIKNLEAGQLPEVSVVIERKSIIDLTVAVVIMGTILILTYQLVKNVSK